MDRLPPGFAEALDREPERVVEARPASTIVLLRDGPTGMETLLLKRTRSAGFVPGAYVFPGGRVDEADEDPELDQFLVGLTAEQAAERLRLSDPRVGLGYYVAALREAFEETGILVGTNATGDPPATAAADPAVDAVRDDLLEDRIGFGEALRRMECTLDSHRVAYIAHWITPVVEPRRYDTRFFAAAVPSDTVPIVDPREMTDAVWVTPSAALERQRAGSLPMIFPTIKTLEQLAVFDTVATALGELRGRPVPAILPRLVRTATGVTLSIPEIVEP